MAAVKKEPSPHVAAKQEAKRQHILTTAMKLVRDEGLAGLTVPKLSKRLGWTVGAMYRYFKNKGAIMTALQLKAMLGYGEVVKEAWRDAQAYAKGRPGEVLVPIVAMAYAFMTLAKTRKPDFDLMNQVMASPAELLPEEDAKKVIVPLMGVLTDLVQPVIMAQAHGSLEAGNALNRLIGYWMAATGILQLRKVENYSQVLDFHALMLDHIRVNLKGWGAEAQEIEDAMAIAAAWYEGRDGKIG